jgi:hypothetical protein
MSQFWGEMDALLRQDEMSQWEETSHRAPPGDLGQFNTKVLQRNVDEMLQHNHPETGVDIKSEDIENGCRNVTGQKCCSGSKSSVDVPFGSKCHKDVPLMGVPSRYHKFVPPEWKRHRAPSNGH